MVDAMDATSILANYGVPNEMPIDYAGSFNSELSKRILCIDSLNDLWRLVVALHIIEREELPTRRIEFTTRLNRLPQVAEQIEDLYESLTETSINIKIRFVGSEPKQDRLLKLNPPGPLILFSGGLDSLAAAYASSCNSHSYLFHAATSNLVLSRAIRLRNSIPILFGDPMVCGDCRFSSLGGGFSQTRGLLFLSAAANAASSLGINEIIMGENGPLMINPSVSPSCTPTRNARPELITDLQNILRSLGSGLRILTVHKDMTKAEVMRNALHALVDSDILSRSYSCQRTQGVSKMCGLCFACFVRRTSLLALGIREADSVYQNDAFATDIPKLAPAEVDDVNDLKDSLAYYKGFVVGTQAPINWKSGLPPSYFEDAEGMLRRFALDLLVGARSYFRQNENKTRNALAEYCLDVIRQVGTATLDARESQLGR